MKIIYIKETEEEDIFKKLKIKIKRLFNIINIKEINNKTIYYLPINKNTKLSNYRIKRLSTKINKLLEKDESNIVAFSEYLQDIKLLKNYLYSQNINILDGRLLFKSLIPKIIEKIFKDKKEKIEFRRSYIINK